MKSVNIEDKIIKMKTSKIVKFCFEKNILKQKQCCYHCNTNMKLVKARIFKARKAWRCINSLCSRYQNRVSIRRGSFFESFKIKLKKILRILIRWSENQTQKLIINKINVSYAVLRIVLDKLIEKIKLYNEENPIVLGGYNKFVEIDETMMNFKCKSHKGRSSNNKTDAICLIEYDNKITKCYAEGIKDKTIGTILPIINRVVIPGSLIFTDEHKSYQNLNKQGFLNGTICHKYEFLNVETVANTQAVGSFNNYLKYWIKFKKGVETHRRDDFLVEFIWKFKHKNKIFKKFLDLLKI